jgi:hypothetical protein
MLNPNAATLLSHLLANPERENSQTSLDTLGSVQRNNMSAKQKFDEPPITCTLYQNKTSFQRFFVLCLFTTCLFGALQLPHTIVSEL